jgi:hypothetical protein
MTDHTTCGNLVSKSDRCNPFMNINFIVGVILPHFDLSPGSRSIRLLECDSNMAGFAMRMRVIGFVIRPVGHMEFPGHAWDTPKKLGRDVEAEVA